MEFMEIQNKLINEEALNSQIYNPSTDKAVIQLYQIMVSNSNVDENDPEDPVMAEYHSSITNLPTDGSTRYAGVLVNPATCYIENIRTELATIPNLITPITSGYPSTRTEWNAYLPILNQDIADINNNLNLVQNHTDRLTTNLPSLVGIAQGALALATLLNALSNPCLGLDGFFGSIMDSGKQLFQEIDDQITSLKNTISDAIVDFQDSIRTEIGPLIDEIKDQISIIKGQISEAITMASDEVSKFAKAQLAQARQGLADLMSNLPKDPCLRSLLGSVVTGPAAGIIG